MKNMVISSIAFASIALAGCGGGTENQCPQGQSWDGQSCVGQQPQCPPGQTFNGQMCVAQGANCPAGQTWNGQACVAGGAQCPAGQSWDGQQCVAEQQQCPAGQTWNGQACVAAAAAGQCSAATTADVSVTGPLLASVVGQHVPAGSKPVGGAVYGNFTTGQCVQMAVTLQPGKCYTVLGIGLPGVADLDVSLAVAPVPGIPPQTIAQDQTDGGTAVLGGKPNCFNNLSPVPLPAQLIVRVEAGQGAAAAQLYEK